LLKTRIAEHRERSLAYVPILEHMPKTRMYARIFDEFVAGRQAK
jgi:hypothetical protein